MFRAVRPGLPKQSLLPAIRAFSIMRAMWPFRRPTSFLRTTVNQFNAGYNRIFDYISSQGTGAAKRRRSAFRAPTWEAISCGLTSIQLDGGYWSLGDRGYSPVPGRHQRFLHFRFLRHDSREPRHQGRHGRFAPTR